jgi:hypothetical protein
MRRQISSFLSRVGLGFALPYLHHCVRFVNRSVRPVGWHNLRRVTPLCRDFGFQRGTPVDRFYIEQFLHEHSQDIRGHVLEVANARYTTRFGQDKVVRSDVLHVDPAATGATIIGNLATGEGIPQAAFDCIILTETLFCIYDLRSTVAHLIAALKPGGVALISTAGIAQISKHDRDRWGDFWRLTTMSMRALLEEVVPADHITVTSGGNVLAAVSLLHGIVVEDLSVKELEHYDDEYEVVVLARVVKPLTSDQRGAIRFIAQGFGKGAFTRAGNTKQ